jgi:2-dehydropantoate 2-reductase
MEHGVRILVYGAGGIGSLYAALLKESGQEVFILARGPRLADIREHGIRLEDSVTGKRTTLPVETVERLGPEDAYDLVLVILPKNHVAEVLPILAANRHTPNVMFFGNNAAGPGPMVEALGRERVLLGFPGAAAATREECFAYLILSAREQPTTIGELDGAVSARIEMIADALRTAGFPVAICPRMDAWLKTHAAEISPTANALYMANTDPSRLANTRDALLVMLRAIREGYRVLKAQKVPITPPNHRIFLWLPEWLLLFLMRRMLASDTATIKIGHAIGARNEMMTLAAELRDLARQTDVPTPNSDTLRRYLDPQTEPVAEASSAIPVHWGAVAIALAVAATGGLFAALLLWPAGRLDWTLGWIYVGLTVAFMVVSWLCLQRWNPELIEARMRIGKGTKSWDKVWAALFAPAMIAMYVVAGLEARDGRASLPESLWLPGLVVFVAGSALLLWPMVVNPFFEKTVRIQTERGHRVIDTGPYAYLRHPGYLGLASWFVATPLLLLSAWSFLPALLALIGLVIRTALEDRMLRNELAGYREYAARVRFRLIPGVW